MDRDGLTPDNNSPHREGTVSTGDDASMSVILIGAVFATKKKTLGITALVLPGGYRLHRRLQVSTW